MLPLRPGEANPLARSGGFGPIIRRPTRDEKSPCNLAVPGAV